MTKHCDKPLWYLHMKSEGTIGTENSSCSFVEECHGSTISAITLEEDYLLSPMAESFHPFDLDAEQKWESESKLYDTLRPPSKTENRFSSCSDAGDSSTPCAMPRRQLSIDFGTSFNSLDYDLESKEHCDNNMLHTDYRGNVADSLSELCQESLNLNDVFGE